MSGSDRLDLENIRHPPLAEFLEPRPPQATQRLLAVELLGLLGLTSRLGLSKNYLHPALEAGLIEMANPLTPTDRNQRYRKVSQ